MQPVARILSKVDDVNTPARPAFRVLGLLAAGVLVFAARSREIHLYAGDVPILDQWKVEGADILQPWLEGTLRAADFLRPHNGHVPVWSRLLFWVETTLTERWDPRVQMAVNAAIHAAFVTVFLRWLWSALSFRTALAASVLLLATAVLPFAWENITWGFQSQFPLALLFLLVHVPGVLTRPAYSSGWLWAQAAGLAGLFTLGIMWTAPLAVGLALLWTGAFNFRQGIVPGLLVAGGIVLAVVAPTPTDSALFVHSLPLFLHAWFVQLGWPAATVLVNVPLVLLALQLRGRKDAPPFDRVVLALGVWSLLQAAAIAYARSAEYVGFTSRYGDLLVIGTMANFLALVRLASARFPWRGIAAMGILAWLGVVGAGLHAITTTAHTAYFHDHAAGQAALREGAVRGYVGDGDIGHLSGDAVRAVLYPDPAEVARQLSRPALRALLPVVSGPSAAGVFTRQLQARWAWLGGLALAGLGVALLGLGRQPAILPPLTWQPDPVRLPLLAGLAAASLAGLFLWPRPLVFGEVARKTRILQASGTIAPLRYEFVGRSAFPPERIVGAADISPGEVRNLFHGPVDLGRVRSNSFHLITPRLVVPFAGRPTAPGVALQVVVENGQGEILHVYHCRDAAPADVNFWELDVSENQKRSAYLALTDDSAGAGSWIAVAPPQYAWKEGQAAIRAQAWAAETHASAHETLGLIGGLSLLGCAWLAVSRRMPSL